VALSPSEQSVVMVAISQSLDKIQGELAALIAYVAHTTGEIPAGRDVESIKTMARQIAPNSIGTGTAGAPATHALQTVDRILSIARSIQAVKGA
jgi:hypothetical protein